MKRDKLKNLTLRITDGEHGSICDTPDTNFFLLSNKNIIDGQIVVTNNDRTISEDILKKINKRTQLSKNDIVISTVGTIGKVALIEETPNYEFQRSVGIIKCDESKLLPEYLLYFLSSEKVQARLKLLSKGAIQKCLFISDLEEFEIDYPESIEVQKKTVEALKQIDMQIQRNKDMVHKLQLNDTTISCFSMKGKMRYAS